MKNITFRQLKSIRAIEKHEKVVGAAKVLGLTAPAVTLQLKQIEAEAGVPLFDRTAHGMFPTEAGHAVLSAARDIEQRLAQLQEELDAFKGVKRGRIAVGAVSTVKYFAQPMVAAFAAAYPDIDLELFIDRRAETVERLRSRMIDVALLGRPPREFSVRAAIFGQHSLVAVSARHHPLVGRYAISKAEIAREHFYLRNPDSGTRVFFDRFMSEIPGRADGPNTEMESIDDIKQAILSDNGVAFLAVHSVAAEVQAGKLAILDVVGLPIRRQWFAVSRTDRAITPLIAAFESFLSSEGKKFLPDFVGLDDAPA
ncbi:LysR family transcriptional regulator [Aminobacter sp. UC22_36]|uniref:LysR family transcriptional regulator n=1 Tax=Aminobacter sp. UC22_36 TaxID=3374549 RepID=UPI003756789B